MGVLQVLQAVSIVIASWTAIYGISAWKRETVGKRRIELAEEVLSLFYRARRAIAQMRGVLLFASEASDRQADPDETEGEKAAMDAAYIRRKRFDAEKEVFERLFAIRFRFMAVLGTECEEWFVGIDHVVTKVLSAADQLAACEIENSRHQYNPLVKERNEKYVTESLKVVRRSDDKSDEVANEVEKIIGNVESRCSAFIRGNGPSWANRAVLWGKSKSAALSNNKQQSP